MRKLRQRGLCWGSPGVSTCLSLLSSEKRAVQDPYRRVQCFSLGEPSASGHGRERPESLPPPDGGGRGLRAAAAAAGAAARGDAGTPGGGVSAGKTEEIKTRRALLPAACPPPPPAGAWVGGGLSVLPLRGRVGPPSPGAPGKVRSVSSPPPPQVRVVSGDPPGTSLQKAGLSVSAAPDYDAPLGVVGNPPGCPGDPPPPHCRTVIQTVASTGFRSATLGFPGPETTEGSPEWYQGSPFP